MSPARISFSQELVETERDGREERMVDVDERDRREGQLEAWELQQLKESGSEKMGDVSADVDEELVLVGGKGPVPYKSLLTEEEYQAFRVLAEKEDPTPEEVARGQALLQLMMDRYPDGPVPK
jgi:hypothetical protein